jgi:hypothetical protein
MVIQARKQLVSWKNAVIRERRQSQAREDKVMYETGTDPGYTVIRKRRQLGHWEGIVTPETRQLGSWEGILAQERRQ